MRRKDREITDRNEITAIMEKCEICNIALFDEDYPYIVPLNFGFTYEDNNFCLYFHCAREGKKLELIRNNPKTAFEMSCSHKLITGEKACDYTMEFESVCGNGIMEVLPEDQKLLALTQLMKHYSKAPTFSFDEHACRVVTVLRLTVNEITGKRLKK
ncbi:MAG: hypothetical protein K0S76_2099 [Herbinix sp.]|jgi:nitroimidazol reductase NimA-like FMN-containing flavoprotein (pyridoxamine 5'-phosphate oxidase superfamily)|nr:hypothetical protein [Herbinix sp.]